MIPTLILGFPEYRPQTEALAQASALPHAWVDIHIFPDGESRLTLPVDLPAHLILCRGLDHPNGKLLELLLVARAAREQGVQHITLVAPYLAYMRQDKAFHPGEVVSQHHLGRLLADHIDAILTVDSHLHRVHRLADAIPVDPAINLTATEPMAHFLRRQPLETPLLLGPDGESEQWVQAIASHHGLDYRVASKQRLGDQQVQVALPPGDYQGRHVVLVDDVASTGRTLEAAATQLATQRPASLSVLVTHALFLGDAQRRLHRAGVQNIWSCDSIPHPTNAVPLAELLAGGLEEMVG